MRESMIHPTQHVCVASNTLKVQSSDWRKKHRAFWCYIISSFFSDPTSFLTVRQTGCRSVNNKPGTFYSHWGTGSVEKDLWQRGPWVQQIPGSVSPVEWLPPPYLGSIWKLITIIIIITSFFIVDGIFNSTTINFKYGPLMKAFSQNIINITHLTYKNKTIINWWEKKDWDMNDESINVHSILGCVYHTSNKMIVV